jgi:hypothetical protein
MEPESSLKHTKHVFRVFILLLAVLVTMILGRGLFVPASWGEYGWYRGDAATDHRAKPIQHGGDQSCTGCHATQAAAHDDGRHVSVRCEVCHNTLASHVADGKKIAAMAKTPALELCTRCHRKLAARPADFPQVNPTQHLADNGVELSDNVCVECHDPHSPL